MKKINGVPYITSEQQDEIIKKRYEERTMITLSTHDDHPDCKKNRIIAYDLCKKDWKFAINNFFWIQDPEADDLSDKHIPFILWDFQERAGQAIVDAVLNGQDLPIEKARKLGLTWLVLAILTWGWNFHEWEVLVGSRKAEEVDRRGEMGTLFQKIRYMVSRFPDWIFPMPMTHYHDKVMMLVNPLNKASIVGEGNNPDFGRSDRRKVVFLDEFTSWEQTDRAAYQGLSATTKCRISVSTPNRRGTNCWFYQVIEDHKKKGKPSLTLNWWQHPKFNKDLYFNELGQPRSPWYNEEVRRASDLQSVAQEIDINYEASMAGKVFGEFSYSKQVDDSVAYDPNLPLYIAWDFGLDQTFMMWIQYDRKNNLYYIIDEYANDGSGQGDNIYHYIDILDSKPYKTAIHYGDPFSGNNRSITSGQSPANILRRQGIVFRSQRAKIVDRIRSARNILSQVRVSPDCTLTTEMFSAWQMRKPKSGSTSSQVPDHSEHSHCGEAFSYFAFNFKNNNKSKQTRHKKKYTHTTSGVTL